MNNLEFKGNWNIARGRLKQKFAQLSDNDLRYEEGREEELVGRIQKAIGRTRHDVETLIRESLKS